MKSLNEAAAAAIGLITIERVRQVVAKGYTPAGDTVYRSGELLDAARAYCASAAAWPTEIGQWEAGKDRWPWNPVFFEPESPQPDLIRAGALVCAEIERLYTTPHSVRGNADEMAAAEQLLAEIVHDLALVQIELSLRSLPPDEAELTAECERAYRDLTTFTRSKGAEVVVDARSLKAELYLLAGLKVRAAGSAP